MKKYLLTETELQSLLEDRKLLESLLAYGVNGWHSYTDALMDEDYTVTAADFAGYTVYSEEVDNADPHMTETDRIYCTLNIE